MESELAGTLVDLLHDDTFLQTYWRSPHGLSPCSPSGAIDKPIITVQ
jgi:hypothetical protein